MIYVVEILCISYFFIEFPPLNNFFPAPHYISEKLMRKLYEFFKILQFQKRNSCCGNYMQKYGMYFESKIMKRIIPVDLF